MSYRRSPSGEGRSPQSTSYVAHGSSIDISREALILHHESTRNKERIAQLHHQLKTAEVEAQARQRAAMKHIQTMRKDVASLAEEVETAAEEGSMPGIPRSKVEATQAELHQCKRSLQHQQTELTLLQDVMKAHWKDERLRLPEMAAALEKSWGGRYFEFLEDL